MCKFRSCYYKCLTLFFGYKYITVLLRLLETGLPSFDTGANASFNFRSRWSHCSNSMVIMLRACSSYACITHSLRSIRSDPYTVNAYGATVTLKSTPDTVSYGQRVRSPRSARTVSMVTHGRPYGLYGRPYGLYGRSCGLYGMLLRSPRKV